MCRSAVGGAGQLGGLVSGWMEGRSERRIGVQRKRRLRHIAEAVGDVHGDGEVVVAKPAMVTKKDNRAALAAAKKAKFKADRAKAANIELPQRLCGAAGSVMSGLGEEVTSEGRLGRGGGGEERLGEGWGEGQFQIYL